MVVCNALLISGRTRHAVAPQPQPLFAGELSRERRGLVGKASREFEVLREAAQAAAHPCLAPRRRAAAAPAHRAAANRACSSRGAWRTHQQSVASCQPPASSTLGKSDDDSVSGRSSLSAGYWLPPMAI